MLHLCINFSGFIFKVLIFKHTTQKFPLDINKRTCNTIGTKIQLHKSTVVKRVTAQLRFRLSNSSFEYRNIFMSDRRTNATRRH